MIPPNHTVLLIESDTTAGQAIRATLSSVGYTILTVERGLEGVDVARKVEPDIILTALDLPDLNGAELTATLRTEQRFHRTPIIAMIEEDSQEQRDLAFAAGMNGNLAKPINLEALPAHIEFFLSGGTDGLEDTERMRQAQGRFLKDVVQRLEQRIRALEEQNQALARVDQMKDTFIQLTAHELRTPLTLITGYSRLLEDHPPLQALRDDDESIGTLIDGLTESIGRMQGIIEEVMTVSRIMTSEIELNIAPINLGSLVRKVLQAYKDAFIEREQTVVFDESQWPKSMRVDGDLLGLVISNLVSNAIKYTPNGGQITLTAQMTNRLVRFTVKDNGVGIDKKRQSTIFERFAIGGDIDTHTTSKTAFMGGGLGLGLAICQGIIEAHRGKISVNSRGYNPDKCPGSEFMVVLPLSITSSPAAKSLASNMKKLEVPPVG